MARIKRKSANLVSGILEPASGQALPIEFLRNGVITGLREPIYVKRPNQYKNKMR